MVVVGGVQLANPNVQRECMKALQGDPIFSQLLENFQNGVRPDFMQLIKLLLGGFRFCNITNNAEYKAVIHNLWSL
jgi:hypothetical protein